ncbi:RraA family protein [Kineosporia succinea]|uniref:Putative 4-hydroxy-4-methyl-2-oxoglutarate aldolase n=1 Tax=Kineosporia succinea TaxID=84632 RepID=A0ABT9PA01_9ACTN|nr:4-carboxy-4-hydroxy-2-oxoadipate aldolase/oxaloacetate decarboxylase [Kineosporia succinea]MDP9829522.1 4-hydroxy-4-methyl-2-oxoglutarate aldolase [Kineosporia succinea]
MSGVYEELAALGVATVYEAAGRQGLVDVELEQLLAGTSVAGPARIAACAQDDNWAVHQVMPSVRPGEVLVLAMPEPRPVALVGDLLLTQAKVAGAVGVMVDASVRDVDAVRHLGLPVWARWRRVRGAAKDSPGEVDVAVTVGGQRIEPGDAVLMDADGACVVPAARIDEVLVAARARAAREATLRTRYENGEFSYDLNGLREKEGRS